MSKASDESIKISKHINVFLNEYVPSQKSKSDHTLKSYEYALSLYIGFLETKKNIKDDNLSGSCFGIDYIVNEYVKLIKICK